MASLTRNSAPTEGSPEQPSTSEVAKSGRGLTSPLATFASLPVMYKWAAGLAATIIVLVACLVVWGPAMEFPTTVSRSTLETVGGGSIVNERSLRQATTDAINDGVKWITREAAWLFGGITTVVDYALIYIEKGLFWVPWPVMVIGLTLLAFAMGRWSLAAFTCAALLYIGFMDLWSPAIETIALIVVAVAICMAIGLPLGVLGARNRMADNLMRPILDGMQTMPSFVYLLPGILFFGLGKPAGIFATLIYAAPPVIRLTNLGIRQVSSEAVEAARSFGASPTQVLTKVQIPMALPTIMAGINQTTMMALAMVTIASLVAAGGLGEPVLRALQKNDAGFGAIAGLAIVFLAIVIDRLTQSAARNRQESMGMG